jgi:hypothetical protein
MGTDNQYRTIILGNPVERLERFKPLGWYGVMGYSIKRNKWQKFLAAMYYYRLRWLLGWGKNYKRCECECGCDDDDWDEDDNKIEMDLTEKWRIRLLFYSSDGYAQLYDGFPNLLPVFYVSTEIQ